MNHGRKLLVAAAVLATAAAGYGAWRLAVSGRPIAIPAELVVLGDLDDDQRWTQGDLQALEAFLEDPFAFPDALAWRLDLNQNGLLDEEDVAILRALVAAKGDPFAAEAALPAGTPFPRPRELYRWVSTTDLRPRPVWALPYLPARDSVLAWLAGQRPPGGASPYAQALDADIRAEAVRFDQAYHRRQPGLLPIERDDLARKLARVRALHRDGQRYELLLALMELVEDAETVAAPRQPDLPLRLLAFRDHLRRVLESPLQADLAAGRRDWRAVLRAVSGHLRADLGVELDLETLGPPRNLGPLQHYLDRAEWQHYESSAREQDLVALVAYAQRDPRYLRAAARTGRRARESGVEDQRLPMILLFREALRIERGDKKKAIGLLDEALGLSYAWSRPIPREVLPASLALESFLLPGVEENGVDRSRDWTVLGGLCLYRSPREALDLALAREMQGLRDGGYTATAMRERLRDLIADVDVMYRVLAVDPGLLDRGPRTVSAARR